LLGISSTTDVVRQLNRINPEMGMFVLGFVGSGDIPALIVKEENGRGKLSFPRSPTEKPKSPVADDVWAQAGETSSSGGTSTLSTEASAWVYANDAWVAVKGTHVEP
jgi:hypothetical protein